MINVKLLHIFKSEPDEIVKKMIQPLSEGKEVRQINMYTGDVDYDKLVEMVFEHDRVISWW